MKAKAPAKPKAGWRVVFPAGNILDFLDCEYETTGDVLEFYRGDRCIAMFRSWAGFYEIETQ